MVVAADQGGGPGVPRVLRRPVRRAPRPDRCRAWCRPLVTGAHRVRRQPPHRSSARERAGGRRVVAPRAAATAPQTRARFDGRGRSAGSRARSRAPSPTCGRRSSITAPASRMSATSWTEPGARAAGQRASARITCSRQFATRGSSARCSSPARRSSTGRPRAPLSEDDPIGPSDPYGVSKLAQEMLAMRTTHAPVFVVRPFNHAGPRQCR